MYNIDFIATWVPPREGSLLYILARFLRLTVLNLTKKFSERQTVLLSKLLSLMYCITKEILYRIVKISMPIPRREEFNISPYII